MLGRLMAAEQLGTRNDRGAVGKMKDALNKDEFYGVRLAASQALRSIQSDEAYDALLSSARQPDARVRRQVLSDITSFYRERSYEHAATVVESEKNPAIRAEALTALGAYHKPA